MPEIKMPKLSDTMTEGTLVAWKLKKGDKVSAGDVLAEIETDKATMEWESTDDGVLEEIYVKEGTKVGVGDRIALVLAPGEKRPSGDVAPKENKETPASKDALPKAVSAASAPAVTAKSSGGRIKASPLAKKIAASKGVDLSNVSGTGPGGRIVQRDVENFKGGSAPAGTFVSAPIQPSAEGERIPLSGMRKVIAERLLQSKTTIPHFYLNIEVDVEELMKLRAEVNAASEATGSPKITVNDFVLRAAVLAAVRIPKVNASFDRDAVIEYNTVNLAVAVAIEDGLVTPVIRDAQKKGLRELSGAMKDLATRARSKKLKPEEYQGGTITISNLGAYGIESFDAIINPPQSIILSVGAIVKKPVVNAKNEIVVGQRMAVGLSCDHRVVDGAIGAQYLAELRKYLENPTLMLV